MMQFPSKVAIAWFSSSFLASMDLYQDREQV